ncbi:TIGR03620 family F420-dependent LLM class oxidoreductase [Actinoplanes sp. TBRC 11911]|uniref:TIGR03620 family F420-dependent LLM class oxidoreductase n=1 Tax=Actinoplanes sp. TBRC 11911 TaxID=2729386 RepID=UPI00145F55B1|nr:TIGR03620 family F420-dependent LLM class oxidoreductase [Actinoplanes sp. TBRC 11911]NMO56752.1 TIGR03620 family F420-dependent LLM class oxidoreductase [Actinoplanes sp. TBRC 11911]
MNDIGRYGIWVPARLWPANAGEVAAAAQELESLGYGTIWLGSSPPDDLELPEAVLAATSRLTVGTSIVDIWRSNGARLAASHMRIRRHFPGRFFLGVGSGHAPAAEALGQMYVRPLSRLRDFVSDKLHEVPQEERLIAALGPRALDAARELTAGALPYLMPPAHTADSRTALGPDRLLVVEQKVFMGTDPAQAREVARRRLRSYLALPNYTNALKKYGMSDSDLTGDGSDRFVDSAVVWGDDQAVRAGIDAHLAAGADQVAIQALSADPTDQLPRDEWRRLASILF